MKNIPSLSHNSVFRLDYEKEEKKEEERKNRKKLVWETNNLLAGWKLVETDPYLSWLNREEGIIERLSSSNSVNDSLVLIVLVLIPF